MPYSTHDRATFVTLLPHLGPDGDRDEVVRFVRDRWAESLEELGSRPGWDQVRAGLLRLLPSLVRVGEREELLGAADRALEAYAEDLASEGAALLVARHPAWVGLSALELADQRGVRGAHALGRAVDLATVGFRTGGHGPPSGRGEVLWAMAEQAEEAGWADRARQLLEAALTSDFEDPTGRTRVRLLLGLRLVEDDEDGGIEILEGIADDDDADDQARVHALWVLAAIARRQGDDATAREALQRAAALVDADGEPDVAARIGSALAELDDDGRSRDEWD